MGIYINGIEMPKACSDCFAERCIGSDFGCDILGFDDANTTCLTRKRRKDCPLVEVPPHGDLIDREALIRALHAWFDDDEVHAFEKDAYWHHGVVMKIINESPTIIPAEEDE